MEKIPQKIKTAIEKNGSYNWIEHHDRIYTDKNERSTLFQENQFKFWQTNCSIRIAFKEIENEIYDRGKKVSIRLVGWSEIARRANCDRNTLKHPDRAVWIEKRRAKLLADLNDVHMHGGNKELIKINDEENELIVLSQQIEASKRETAKWFIKYQDMQNELEISNELLKRQMESNGKLYNEIKDLKHRIKVLMANYST